MKLEKIEGLELQGGELVEVRLLDPRKGFITQPFYYGYIVKKGINPSSTENFPSNAYVALFKYKNNFLEDVRRIPIDQVKSIQRPGDARIK